MYKFNNIVFLLVVLIFNMNFCAQQKSVTTWKPVAAGVLPITQNGNYILGRQTCIDIKNEGLYDYFAGMIDPEDHGSPFKAAVREFSEESRWPKSLPDVETHLFRYLDAITILATKSSAGYNTFGVMYHVRIPQKTENTWFVDFGSSYNGKLKERNTFLQYMRHQLNMQPMNAYLEKDVLVVADKEFKLCEQSTTIYGLSPAQKSIVKMFLEGIKSILRMLKNRLYPAQNKICGTKQVPVRPILKLLLDESNTENQFKPKLTDEIKVPNNWNQAQSGGTKNIPVYIFATEKIKRWIGNDYQKISLTEDEKSALYEQVKKDLPMSSIPTEDEEI